jgi:integrase
LKVLTPIWSVKSETASRVRGRIERVLDFAKANGWRSGENPALWRGHLKNVLPARHKLTRGHHAAMPHQEVPGLIEHLHTSEAMSARMLEFLILTAARTGEVLLADWKEIDWKAKVWTVPPERMKAAREHRVPLTEAAISILKPLHELRKEGLIFPSAKATKSPSKSAAAEKPLSNLAMTMLLRRLNVTVTVHGFRSSFRDWVGDATSFPRELAEAALAHVVGDETERAYRRSDALAKRRKLMEAWSAYLVQNKQGNVVKLVATK